jgi:hypothetical protein
MRDSRLADHALIPRQQSLHSHAQIAFALIFLLLSLPALHFFPLLYLSVVFICHPSSLYGHLFAMPPQQYRSRSAFNELSTWRAGSRCPMASVVMYSRIQRAWQGPRCRQPCPDTRGGRPFDPVRRLLLGEAPPVCLRQEPSLCASPPQRARVPERPHRSQKETSVSLVTKAVLPLFPFLVGAHARPPALTRLMVDRCAFASSQRAITEHSMGQSIKDEKISISSTRVST